MWESESDAGERGLVPVLGGSGRHDGLKTDGFVRRDQSWYVLGSRSNQIYMVVSLCAVQLIVFLFFLPCNLSRYVNSDISSDLLVKVGDVSFHLHKVHFFFFFFSFIRENHPQFRRPLPSRSGTSVLRTQQLNHWTFYLRAERCRL